MEVFTAYSWGWVEDGDSCQRTETPVTGRGFLSEDRDSCQEDEDSCLGGMNNTEVDSALKRQGKKLGPRSAGCKELLNIFSCVCVVGF